MVPRKRLRIDVFFENLAWPERNDASRSNSDLFASSRVSPFSCSLAAHNKISKACNFDRISLLQNRLENVEHQLDDIRRLVLGYSDLLKDLVRDIRLSHASSLAVSLEPLLRKSSSSIARSDGQFPYKLREVISPVKD